MPGQELASAGLLEICGRRRGDVGSSTSGAVSCTTSVAEVKAFWSELLDDSRPDVVWATLGLVALSAALAAGLAAASLVGTCPACTVRSTRIADRMPAGRGLDGGLPVSSGLAGRSESGALAKALTRGRPCCRCGTFCACLAVIAALGLLGASVAAPVVFRPVFSAATGGKIGWAYWVAVAVACGAVPAFGFASASTRRVQD